MTQRMRLLSAASAVFPCKLSREVCLRGLGLGSASECGPPDPSCGGAGGLSELVRATSLHTQPFVHRIPPGPLDGLGEARRSSGADRHTLSCRLSRTSRNCSCCVFLTLVPPHQGGDTSTTWEIHTTAGPTCSPSPPSARRSRSPPTPCASWRTVRTHLPLPSEGCSAESGGCGTHSKAALCRIFMNWRRQGKNTRVHLLSAFLCARQTGFHKR